MGRKKRFIDKKNAVSFRLVHRSQRDPLQADEDSSKRVLLPMGEPEGHTDNAGARGTTEDRKKEQRDHGIFYDDEYDYLQHLKHRTDTSLEPLPSNVTVIEAKKADMKKFGKVALPSEVFASSHEEDEGLLNLAAPVSGPRLDWDPDIVAALDDALDLDDPNNILDDDFILKANESFEDCSNIEDDKKGVCSNGETDDEEYFPDDDDQDDWDFGDKYDDDDAQSKFSNYSMTSAVIRRTQGLCLLDDRFDKIMEEYEDDEIGALDHEEVSGNRNLNDPLLESLKNDVVEEDRDMREPLKTTRVTFNIQEERKSSSEDEGFTKIEEIPKEQWDCESILSTYSNLYNHPTVIKETRKESGENRINLSKREGIPLGVLSDRKKNRKESTPDQSEESVGSRASHVRVRGETKEDKKARKQLVKQERQTRRVEKKTNKLLFKEERKRQEKSNFATVVGQKIQ